MKNLYEIETFLKDYFFEETFHLENFKNNDLERNEIFLIKTLKKGNYILKSYYKKSRKDSEEVALKMLEDISNLSPKCYLSKKDKNYLLLEFKEGKNLYEIINEIDKRELLNIYFNLGKEIRKIHSYKKEDIERDLFDKSIVEIETKIKEFSLDKKFDKIINILKEKKSVFQEKYSLIHGDFDSRNILVKNSRGFYTLSGIIDFEQARYDNRNFDIVNIYMKDLWKDKNIEKSFFKGYNSKNSIRSIDNYEIFILYLGLEMCKRSLGHPNTQDYFETGIKWINFYIENCNKKGTEKLEKL